MRAQQKIQFVARFANVCLSLAARAPPPPPPSLAPLCVILRYSSVCTVYGDFAISILCKAFESQSENIHTQGLRKCAITRTQSVCVSLCRPAIYRCHIDIMPVCPLSVFNQLVWRIFVGGARSEHYSGTTAEKRYKGIRCLTPKAMSECRRKLIVDTRFTAALPPVHLCIALFRRLLRPPSTGRVSDLARR